MPKVYLSIGGRVRALPSSAGGDNEYRPITGDNWMEFARLLDKKPGSRDRATRLEPELIDAVRKATDP